MFDSIFSSIRVIVEAAFNLGSLMFDRYIMSGTDDSTFYLMLLSAVFCYWLVAIILKRKRRRRS